MGTLIYYYTGTGNSLWAGRKLASGLGGAELIPIAGPKKTEKADTVGIVFPVHMWGVLGRVLEFIKNLEKSDDTYYFAAAVNGGQVSGTLLQMEKAMRAAGIKLSAGISVELASNYVPWGGPGTAEEIKKLGISAEAVIKDAAAYIASRKSGRIDKGPMWQRIVYTWIYNLAFNHINTMDRGFWADEKCNGCGVCAKICPAKNITMVSGKPVWNHKCEQCFACIQWCPQQAIQFGKKTAQYPRYHHPEVTLMDMMGAVKE